MQALIPSKRQITKVVLREVMYACEMNQSERTDLLLEILQDLTSGITVFSENMNKKITLLEVIKKELQEALVIQKRTYTEPFFCGMLANTQHKRIRCINSLIKSYETAIINRKKYSS